MPCGLGLHPYFPCSAGTRLATSVDHVWTVDDNVLPVARIAATGRYALDGGPICGRDLDNGYDGWNGRAEIETPGAPFRLILFSPDAPFFQLYSPGSGTLFVAEPVTHANAALNAPETEWGELGMTVLEPGETMSIHMRIDVIDR
jgi:aldose 1-epimerase